MLRVSPGATVPADGVVTWGASDVDEAMLTGESMPVAKTVGSSCFGGTLNGSGMFYLQAMRVGSDTMLASIARLVVAAQASKPAIQVHRHPIQDTFILEVSFLSGMPAADMVQVLSQCTTASHTHR